MSESDEVIVSAGQSPAVFQIGEVNEDVKADVDTSLGIPRDLGLDIDRQGETISIKKDPQSITVPESQYKMPKADENSALSSDYGSTNNDSLLGVSSKKEETKANAKDEKIDGKKKEVKLDKEDEDYLRRRSNNKDLEKGEANADDENDDSTGLELRIYARIMTQAKISMMHGVLVGFALFVPVRLVLNALLQLMISEGGSDDGTDRTKLTVLWIALDNMASCLAMMVILFHLTKYKWTSRSLGMSSFASLWACLGVMVVGVGMQCMNGPMNKLTPIWGLNLLQVLLALAAGGASAYGFYLWREQNEPAQTEAEKKALLKEKRREEKRKQKERKAKEEAKEAKRKSKEEAGKKSPKAKKSDATSAV